MAKAKRAVAYARCACRTEFPGQSSSIGIQLANCRELATQQKWTLVEEYCDDGFAGLAEKSRPAYDRLLHDAALGKFEVVVADSIDRFSRDQAQLPSLLHHMSHHGVMMVTVTEGNIQYMPLFGVRFPKL